MASRRKIHKTPAFSEKDLVEGGIYKPKDKRSIFASINEILAIVMGFILLGLCGIIIVIGLIFFIYAFQTTGVVIILIGGILFTYIVLLRSLRKRMRFVRKLKKKCKKYGFKIEKKRGVFRGLKLNKEGFDLIITAPHTRYYIRFFTPRRHKSHITIYDENTVEIKTNIHNSRWKFILGLDKVKVRRMAYSYSDAVNEGVLRAKKVLLVNPVPHSMFKKDSDGAVIPIGTGERLYDYTIFSGSGFINELQREYEKR